MRLRNNLIIIISLVWLLFFGIVYIGTQLYILRNVKSHEQYEFNENLLRVNKAIDQYLYTLGTFTSDWAYWNDAYDYIEGSNPKFISDNINLLVLANSNINLLMYLNKNGKILIGMMTDDKSTELKPYPKNIEKYIYPGSLLEQHKEAIKNRTGLIHVQDCIILIASSAVSNTDKTKPINGTLIAGRYFTKQLLNKIAEDTGLKLSMFFNHELNENEKLMAILKSSIEERKKQYIVFENEKLAHGYVILHDINDEAIGIIKVEMPRYTYISGLRAISYYFTMLFVSGLVLCILVWFLLKKFILKRIETLSNQIQDINLKKDYATRLPVDAKDELSLLSENFNKMMETIQLSTAQKEEHIKEMEISQSRLENMNKRLVNEVNERKQAEVRAKSLSENLLLASRRAGMADIATSIIKNIQDILNNIVTGVSSVKEHMRESSTIKIVDNLKMMQEDKKTINPLPGTDGKLLVSANDIANLSKALTEEKDYLTKQVISLEKNIANIRNIISMEKSIGSVSEVFEKVKLSKVIDDSLVLSRQGYIKAGIDIIKDIKFTDFVMIDKLKLHYILVNVIKFAIGLMSKTSKVKQSINISVRKLNEKEFVIAITATGIVFSRDDIIKILSVRTVSDAGEVNFGIRSSVVFSRDMGGSLTIETSDSGRGTKFSIILPIVPSKKNQ